MTQKIINGIEHLQETLAGATKVFVVSDSSFPFLNIKDDIENMNEKQYDYELLFVNYENEKNILMIELLNMSEILKMENMMDTELDIIHLHIELFDLNENIKTDISIIENNTIQLIQQFMIEILLEIIFGNENENLLMIE